MIRQQVFVSKGHCYCTFPMTLGTLKPHKHNCGVATLLDTPPQRWPLGAWALLPTPRDALNSSMVSGYMGMQYNVSHNPEP